jgi:hypothetical protein
MNPLELIQSDDIETVQLAVNILVNQENYTVIDIKEKLNFTIFEINYEKSDYVTNQIILKKNWKKKMIKKHYKNQWGSISEMERKLIFDNLN